MKKQYVAPTVYAESFELVEHITGPCSVSGLANHIDLSSCGFKNDESGYLFLNDLIPSKCDYNPYPDDEEALAIENSVNECHYTFDNQYAMFSS